MQSALSQTITEETKIVDRIKLLKHSEWNTFTSVFSTFKISPYYHLSHNTLHFFIQSKILKLHFEYIDLSKLSNNKVYENTNPIIFSTGNFFVQNKSKSKRV
jgi:hypothetical protein